MAGALRRIIGVAAAALAACCVLTAPGCLKRETLVERGNREQILHRAIGHELGDLDPHLATQTIDYHVLSALFEGLVSEDPVDLHPVPGVAESWDIEQGGLVYVFHLRADAKWSNGEPVSAADFVASFRRALSPELGCENASQMHLIRGAAAFNKGLDPDFSKVGLEALDARTLRITLEHPAPYFLASLNQAVWLPVPVSVIARCGPVSQRGNPWTKVKNFVGNGPFRLREWSINHRIVVEKADSYWDRAQVRLKEIHFYPNGIDSQERAFRAGQLHVTDALLPSKMEHYRKTAPQVLRLDPWLGTYFLRCNTRVPALANPHLRRALSLALDREGIVERVLQGGPVQAHSFTPPGMAAYEPPALVQRNLEEARRELALAGHPGGKGLAPLELLLNSSDLHRMVAEAIQENLRRDLGIEIKLVMMENRSVLSARRSGDYQLLVSTWTGDYADPQNFLEIWGSQSGNNFTGWQDPAFEKLLEETASMTEPAKRAAKFREAESLLLQSAPCIPIYHFTHVYLLHPAVRGWHKNLLDHHPYKAVWLEASETRR